MAKTSSETRTESSLRLEQEQQLVEAARSNPEAFGRLFDRYHDPIFNYLLHRTANAFLARDLTADTFFKAYDRLSTFRWRGIPFSAWLYRIAANEASGYFRKHRNYRPVSLDRVEGLLYDESAAADREIIQAEEALQQDVFFVELHRHIGRLKPRYQEVITLRFFENMKVVDIANILGKREGTVKSLIHRAVEQLRRQIDVHQSGDTAS